ncbi:unnamed protein product [Acanthoscelides obtectus]|uniref:Uncharacterized protein n=1 Tax=Acanthoscelides obtectus TaxID=200917 RepID=A0A9P0M3L6_ACAOB|nr:unnamed protein product [Acanthoscelides obtectus]CAK1627267.1 hypothetical protein AOBTE_LOCUS4453 [Acanthoscelides obtectus]
MRAPIKKSRKKVVNLEDVIRTKPFPHIPTVSSLYTGIPDDPSPPEEPDVLPTVPEVPEEPEEDEEDEEENEEDEDDPTCCQTFRMRSKQACCTCEKERRLWKLLKSQVAVLAVIFILFLIGYLLRRYVGS